MQQKNGYYWHEESQKHLIRVSTLLSAVGGKEFLMRWAAQSGGVGVLDGLKQVTELHTLKDRLTRIEAVDWAAEHGIKGLEKAQEYSRRFGTALHAGFEQYLLQPELPIEVNSWHPDDVDNLTTGLRSLRDWHEGLDSKVISVEQAVANVELGYGGRFDYIFNFSRKSLKQCVPYLKRGGIIPTDAGHYITDLKTGMLHPKSHMFQLACYVAALPDPSVIKGGCIIQVYRKTPDKLNLLFFTAAELTNVFENVVKPAVQIWKYFDAPLWWLKQYEGGI